MFQFARASRMALFAFPLCLSLLAALTLPASAAGSFVVTRTADDSLAGSLRGEIALATASPGATITFQIPTTDPGYQSTTKTWTITLNGTELDIAHNLSIVGPNATVGTVAVSGSQPTTQIYTRVFNILAGTVSLSNLTIENGFPNPVGNATADGGGIRNAANLSLANCILTGNITEEEGTAIVNDGANTVLTMTGCAVNANHGTGGGGGPALFNNGGQISLTNCQIDNNNTNSEFDPGGIVNFGTATLVNCEVANNSTYSENPDGAGIENRGGSATALPSTMTLIGCHLTGNFTKGAGGGFYNGGNMTVTGCTLSGNQTETSFAGYASGGGFSNSGTLQVTDSIIFGNRAANQGGGVENNGVLTLTNCIISANICDTGFALDPAGGVANAGTLTMINSTLNGNQSVYCPGLSVAPGSTASIINDIIYGDITLNVSPVPEIVGTAQVTHSDVQGGYSGPGNIDADPLFVRPAEYSLNAVSDPGDLHVTIGSPAIGTGTTGPGVPPADLEGYPRGSHPDMGAYQFHSGFQVQGGFAFTATQNTNTGTRTVAKFVSGTPGLTFTASIAWGDGTTSSGTITADPAQAEGYVVKGSHTYAVYGPQTISVSIADTGHTVSGTALDAATVLPAVIAANVTAQVKIMGGGFVYNRAKKSYFQTVTLKNISSKAIAGTLSLALDDSSLNAVLVNASGTTLYATPANSPYKDVQTGSLAPGATATVVLQITQPGTGYVYYTPRVLAGPGVR